MKYTVMAMDEQGNIWEESTGHATWQAAEAYIRGNAHQLHDCNQMNQVVRMWVRVGP